MEEELVFCRNKEPTWSDRVTFVPPVAKLKALLDSHGREAADDRWGKKVVDAVLKADRHQRRVVAKARVQHAKRHS